MRRLVARRMTIIAGIGFFAVIMGAAATFSDEIEYRYHLYRFQREREYLKEVQGEYPWFWSRGKAKAFYTFTNNEEAYGRWLHGKQNNWQSTKAKRSPSGL